MITDFFKLKGISKRIMLSFSILIIVILVFHLVVSYYLMYVTVQNINKNYISAGLKQKNEKIDDLLNDINLFSKTIISNDDIQKLLVENRDENLNLRKISHEVGYALSNTIDGIFLISNKGKVYLESEIELGEYVESNIPDIRKSIENTDGEMVFFKSQFVSYGSGKHGDYFFLVARKIKSTTTFKDIGFMVIAIRESQLWDNIVLDGDLGDFYLITDGGYIVSCKDKNYIGTNLNDRFEKILDKKISDLDNSSYVKSGLAINSCINPTTKWNIINVVPINELNANYMNFQKVFLASGAIAILAALYISIVISRRITRPIRDMIVSMKSVAAGNLAVQADTELIKDSADEIAELNGVFNKMTKELQYLIEEVYHKNLREKDAELRALKAQINPHFLYNTLDTIYWLLIEKGDFDVAELVTKLGEILRYSIKKGNANVTVEEEIQQVKNYLFIQKSRFEDSFEYEMDIDEDLNSCETLSFLIQPFVENAINHGIMQNKGKGKVVVKVYREGPHIVFEVIDDGEGMTREQIDEVFQGKIKKKSSGIGILNVNERVRYSYGEDYGIAIESTPGKGTRIIIKIPLRKSEGMDHEA